MITCDTVLSKTDLTNVEDCKKLCDNEEKCNYFSTSPKYCRTHNSCQVKTSKTARTIYQKKGKGGTLVSKSNRLI